MELQSPLSIFLIALVAMALMYLGRTPAHGAIQALFRTISQALLSAANAVATAHERLAQRNKEILLSHGRDDTERLTEQEFHRVEAVVARDLAGYPALHRQLTDQIARIDEDYRESTETPPSPPEWVQAVETIAAIPTNGDPIVGRILEEIQKQMAEGQKLAMREYRNASRERNRLLSKMLPFWRHLDRTLDRVDGTIRGLQERSQALDQHMENYEEIRRGSEPAVRHLSASVTTVFASSALVLMIALMGGFINFHLIALPMSEMVGSTSYVGPVKTSDIAAMVIILTEIAMGLFLMESLRITRLFPVISMMDDRMRRRMVWVSFGILFTLAVVESSLAYMRDLLAADREALAQTLVGAQVVEAEFRWIPSVGQMVMGFMLPFALTFVAIPLESFIHSSRTVFGNLLVLVLRAFSGTLRVVASIVQNLGQMLLHVYDFAILVPLRIEQLVTRRTNEDSTQTREQVV